MRLLPLFIRCLLLLTFIIQSILVICRMYYGHIPLPAERINQMLEKLPSGGLQISADAYRLHFDGKVEALALKVSHVGDTKPLLQANSVMLRWGVALNRSLNLHLAECVLFGGTIYLPAVNSPDGMHMPLLSDVAIDLEMQKHSICANSISARLNDWILRGTLELPRSEAAITNPLDTLDTFYKLASQILAFKAQNKIIQKPTINFDIFSKKPGPLKIDLILSLPFLEHSLGYGKQISLNLSADVNNGQFRLTNPAMLFCRRLDINSYKLRANDLNCQIKPEEFNKLIKMEIPEMNLSAVQISHLDYCLDQALIQIKETAPRHIGLAGSASINGQVSAFTTNYDLDESSGTLEARGKINPHFLTKKLPSAIRENLVQVLFPEHLRYATTIGFNGSDGLHEARFNLEARQMHLNDITFDHISVRGRHCRNITQIDHLLAYRDNQNVEACMQINTDKSTIDVLAKGDIIPGHYSQILPPWWGNIFKDFTINHRSPVLADFAVSSEYLKEGATSFFGEIILKNAAYSQVPLQSAHVIVDGTPLHISLDLSEIKSSEGDFLGSIDLTRRQDGIPSLVALHLDVESSLSAEATRNLIGDQLYNLTVGDFTFVNNPYIKLIGSNYFSNHYPEYFGKSHFTFLAESNGPLQYKGVPLDYLNLQGYTDDNLVQLRDMAFGYAGGTGSGSIDIQNLPRAPNTACLLLDLKNAQNQLAIHNLPVFDTLKDDFQPSNQNKEASSESGLLNASLHVSGPVEDPYSFSGQASFHIHNRQLATIQLLGPLSILLQGTALGFTSFELHQMKGDLILESGQARFSKLELNGPVTRIDASGTMELESQALDMQVDVSLFGNAVGINNPITRIVDILNPLTRLLRFELGGTLENQIWRSIYDPRKLIPRF